MPKTTSTPAEWLTVQQVADHFGVSDETVRRWAASGRMRHARLPSGRLRFPREAVDAAVTVEDGSPTDAAAVAS